MLHVAITSKRRMVLNIGRQRPLHWQDVMHSGLMQSIVKPIYSHTLYRHLDIVHGSKGPLEYSLMHRKVLFVITITLGISILKCF